MKHISTQEWLRFIDLNEVSEARIDSIVQKWKLGQLLTEKELSIYISRPQEFEARLKLQ